MYNNLEAEMARAKITRNALAECVGRTPTTLSLKLNGKAPLTLAECIEIKNAVNPECTLDYLFGTEGDGKMAAEEKTVDRFSLYGCDREKVRKAVEECISAMNELTIQESKLAMDYLRHVLNGMYVRDSDTIIGTIQPRL